MEGRASVMMNLDPPKMDPLGYSGTKVQQLPADSVHAVKSVTSSFKVGGLYGYTVLDPSMPHELITMVKS